jgi:Alpha galactosidase C-terminal beta sandwich domain/Alpha galactosidase A
MRRWMRTVTAALLAAPLAVVPAAVSIVATAPAALAAPGGVDQTPVLGWSSWSFLRMGLTAADLEKEARAMVSTGLSAAGYKYINQDDNWYECPGSQGPNVDKYGRWVTNPAYFPSGPHGANGMEVVASYVHRLGLKFGVYETTGISEQAVKENTPILGTPYTADEIATTAQANNYNCGGMVGIDYAKPGAQAYVDSIVDELASWGVDYIKLDGITDSNGPDIKAWSAAIKQSGRPMVLDTTEGSFDTKLAPVLTEYSNQWEFAPDIETSGPDEGSADACNAPPFTGCLSVFPLTSYAHWSDRFGDVAEWQPYGGPGGFNDYDSIEVGDGSADSGMSLAASETQLSLWSLGSAPFILGGDLTSAVTNAYGSKASLTSRDLKLLENRQVIEVDQDAIDAARIVNVGSPGHGAGHQVFAKKEPRGDAVAGLFNTTTDLSSRAVTISVTAKALGLPADRHGYLVQNLWGGQSVVAGATSTRVTSAGVIRATVPAEGVALFRVTPLP